MVLKELSPERILPPIHTENRLSGGATTLKNDVNKFDKYNMVNKYLKFNNIMINMIEVVNIVI